MITSWFTLSKCADYFNGHYRDAVLERCVTFRKNELRLIFHDRKPLIIHLGSPFHYIVPASFPLSERQRHVRIFPELDGARVEHFIMHPNDRVLTIRMKDGSALHLLFMSNRGNVMYTLNEKQDLFKKARLDVSLPEISHETPLFFNSLEQDPRFSPYWKKNISTLLGTDDYREILDILAASNGDGTGQRFLLTNSPEPYDPDIFFDHYRSFIFTRLKEMQFRKEFDLIERRLQDELENLRRKINETRTMGSGTLRAERYRYFAETLAACRHEIPPHQDLFSIPPPFLNERFPDRIPLRSDRTVSENIDDFFKKARSTVKRMEENELRHGTYLLQYEEIEKAYRAFREIGDLRGLEHWKSMHKIISGTEARDNTKMQRRPYKEYIIEGDWRIWVGRSAKDNDMLTFRHAAKSDIWMHVRHGSGSHVIIRKEGKKEIPKNVLAFAASLAARYSDQKHAGLVSVVWTACKYVSRIKNAPPGKVRYQFEKDIMIEPHGED